MEEKKYIKIRLSTFIIIIALIIILDMGYFLYYSNSKNVDNIANDTQQSKMSFSEMMDMLYIKNETQVGEGICYKFPQDSVYMINRDVSENITDIEYTNVSIRNEEIYFSMKKADSNKEVSAPITGITEEVVSVEILQMEAAGIPSAVYFLTRTGNLYYLDLDMINSNNFVAKKVENLSEIVSIDVVDIAYKDAMHGSTTLIATTYSGEKIEVSK